MFGGSRRHRPPNPSLNSQSANPSAATAAASAFMSASNQKSQRTLSSAAAAAALRAQPHTPTNVGEVQTKRTARRSASVSSAGSAAAAGRRPVGQLERRGSSGSMTERTFRSPSPHRPSQSRTMQQEQPPVPQIPASHKKSASSSTPGVGMQNFRTASQKMSSELPSWYTQPSGDTSNVRTSDAAMRTSKSPPPRPASVTPQRPDSRSSSVNYSYPTTFRAQSPPSSPTSSAPQWNNPPPARTPASPPRSSRTSISSSTGGKSDQPMVYDPNSRRMVPKMNVEATVERRVREAAEEQPRKKKKDTGVQRAGSQLAKGTVGRARGTMADNDKRERDLPKREQPVLEAHPTMEESQMLDEPAVKAIITSPQKPKQPDQPRQVQSPELRASKVQSPPPQQPRYDEPTNPPTTSNQAIGKKPSVVREEAEDAYEDVEHVAQPSQRVLNALDAVPTRQAIYEEPQSSRSAVQIRDEPNYDQEPATSQPQEYVDSTAQSSKGKQTSLAENKPVLELSRENSAVRRSNSNSPARQARFAAGPSDNLGVRHVPLPRSASPIKSALKRTSPTPRELSPSDHGSDPSRSRGASPNQRDDPPIQRKKSVRVSFDDRSTLIVGESAPTQEMDSPIPPSPQQAKRPWYTNIGRGKKKEYTLEDDEVMQPRPALPSFGSVREKKAREPEERPLVRPIEPAYSPAMPSSPELRPQSPSTPGESGTQEQASLGQSSDQAIGSMLAQDQKSRNEANISRFREPLPPVVTSIEGNGYISDSLQSSDSEEGQFDNAVDMNDAEAIHSTQATQMTQPATYDVEQNGTYLPETKSLAEHEEAPESTHRLGEDIPEISIIQPSPMALEYSAQGEGLSKRHYFGVPGGFPDDDSDGNHHAHPEPKNDDTTMTEAISQEPADTIFEPTAAVHPAQTETLPQTTLATTTPAVDAVVDDKSTDESDGSIYSDAYEDLSDVDGGGFMSLDAVVESPVSRPAPSQIPELAGDRPEKGSELDQGGMERREALSDLHAATGSQGPALPQDPNDWDRVRAFWRSLNAEKRRQLELEAVEDAGAEGDREEVALPVRRTNSRKKPAEQKQEQPAADVQPGPSTPPPKPAQLGNPERTYMIQPGSHATHEPISPSPKQSRMRTSLRGEQPAKISKAQPPSGMRKTMRSNGGPTRAEPPARRIAPQPEPAMPLPSSRATKSRSGNARPQTASVDASARALSNQIRPTMQRRGSDGSDSSFKRSRATSSEGFGFRRTMRQSSAPQSPAEATRGSGRFSLRSLSPSGSPFRRSSAMNAGSAPPVSIARRTLRSNSESSQEGKRSSFQMPLFGRSSKAPTTKPSNRATRFGDSSDEDEGPSGFHSRFDDSSDEDVSRPSSSAQAGPLAKGNLRGSATAPAVVRRATPVPEEAEESEQLPDSDDDEGMPSPMQTPRSRTAVAARPDFARAGSSALGTSTLTRTRSGRGSIPTSVSAPAMPSPKDKRGSLMGILRRNKRGDQAGNIQRSEIMDSAARRDTKLERSTGQLKDIRNQPSSPKLQKRNSLKRGDSWPLPEDLSDKRPSSAGNLLAGSSVIEPTQRPGLTDRRSMSLGLPPVIAAEDEADNVTVDGTGQKKKKKFGALRRMFGLDN